MPFQYTVRTDKDSHFTGAIAQNAKEDENVSLPGALAGVNGNARSLIRSIVVQSDENLAWELAFWSKDTFDDTDLDVDTFQSRWTFVVADGIRFGGAGQYYYYIDGLDIPYVDGDNSGELHISLVNRSSSGKSSGGSGEAIVAVTMQPMGPEGGSQ
jgi:hypothetical protein